MAIKRTLLLLLAASLACSGAACKKNTPAQDAAKIKKDFQDAQRLRAIKTYEEIAKKYPESPNAAEATARATKLRAIAGPQTATPAKKK